MSNFCHMIDVINEWSGKIVSYLFFPLAIITTYEVIMRYFLNRPTNWAWEMNIQIMAAIIFVGGAYTLLHRGHVTVDLLVSRFSNKTRAIINITTSPVFFFAFGILLWKGFERAWEAVLIREAATSVFGSPLYPLRVLLPIGIFLLMLQGISHLYTDILTLTGRQPRSKGKE